jgi:LysR family transcriptional regulator, hydrogen peroxide-inducible genes activator
MKLTPHPFSLRQLQYIVAVADHKSFRNAAAACHVAQPSLSAQVAQVEELLAIQLFERDRRKVALTAAGAAFVTRARALLIAADDMVELAHGLADPFAATLRVGIIPTVGPYLLPEIAPALRKRYPKLQFVWVEDKTSVLAQRLERAELDAAIVALEADAVAALPHAVLGRDPFVFAAPKGHPLASGKGVVRAEQLAGERVLLLDDGHCFRDQALSFCARTGAEESDYRATSLPTLVQMAANGGGVTLLPSLAVALENRRHSLQVRPFAPKAPGRTLALVWRKTTALTTVLTALAETLRQEYARVAPRERAPAPRARQSSAAE